MAAMVVLGGCNEPDDECHSATAIYDRVESDTLCYGYWNWEYSLKWEKDWQGEWVLSDTVFPNEIEPGFAEISEAWVKINDREICVVVNGERSCGCYKHWSSSYLNAQDGSSDSVVHCLFEEWEVNYYIGVSVYLPPVLTGGDRAQIGTRLFLVEDEEHDGVRYRDRYIRVE